MVSCGLILGGAISNLCDRITLGYVVDYFDFRVWPVFNISDSCITTGTGLLLIDSFKKTKNN
jgi:signal peptidase II